MDIGNLEGNDCDFDLAGLSASSDTAHLLHVSAMAKGVDCLLIAKPVMQLFTRGYAATVRSFRCCRLLVVLTEGHDFCLSKTGRVVSEICEIEVQGVFLRWLQMREYTSLRWKSVCSCEKD